MAGLQVDQLHWLFSDGVGTSSNVAAMAAPYNSKLISISAATVLLHDVRDFFLEALDNPRPLGRYWQSLVSQYLQGQLRCFHNSSVVDRCGLRDRIAAYDYVPAALDSLYSMAALLRSAQAAACGRVGVSGVCRNLSAALEAGLLSVVQPQPLNFSSLFTQQRLPRAFAADRMLVPDEFGDFVPANSPLYFINAAAGDQWTKVARVKRLCEGWGLNRSL